MRKMSGSSDTVAGNDSWEPGLLHALPAETLRSVRRVARRHRLSWILWRILALPLLALSGALGILKTWDGFLIVVGIVLCPFFAIAALVVHVVDIWRVARSPVRLVTGEALGQLSKEYDESTFAFEVGRKRDLLVDVDKVAVLAADGGVTTVNEDRGCRPFRTSRSVRRSLSFGDDVALVVLDERAFDTLRNLAAGSA